MKRKIGFLGVIIVVLISISALVFIVEFGTEYEVINKVTGSIVAVTGLLMSRPRVGSSIMIIVILSLICYYSRERIEKLIEKIREKK